MLCLVNVTFCNSRSEREMKDRRRKDRRHRNDYENLPDLKDRLNRNRLSIRDKYANEREPKVQPVSESYFSRVANWLTETKSSLNDANPFLQDNFGKDTEARDQEIFRKQKDRIQQHHARMDYMTQNNQYKNKGDSVSRDQEKGQEEKSKEQNEEQSYLNLELDFEQFKKDYYSLGSTNNLVNVLQQAVLNLTQDIENYTSLSDKESNSTQIMIKFLKRIQNSTDLMFKTMNESRRNSFLALQLLEVSASNMDIHAQKDNVFLRVATMDEVSPHRKVYEIARMKFA